MDIEEKKATVLRLLALHPSEDWYTQCLEMNLRASEIEALQDDNEFLNEVKTTLFFEKQKLLNARFKSIQVAGVRGGWQGYDKLLTEIDRKMFSVSKDIKESKGQNATEVYVRLPDNGRG